MKWGSKIKERVHQVGWDKTTSKGREDKLNEGSRLDGHSSTVRVRAENFTMNIKKIIFIHQNHCMTDHFGRQWKTVQKGKS